MLRLCICLLACSLLAFYPIAGNTAEPSLAQCQGEPSKGTGWGTFWMVYGGLNAISGAAIYGAADEYDFVDGKAALIGGMVFGGALMGLGIGMRHSAQKYNKACRNILSDTGLKLTPLIGHNTGGARLIYRW